MNIELGEDGIWRPAFDKKLRQVEFMVEDLKFALPFVGPRAVAVQAGGAQGLWAKELAKHFFKVYTYEPNLENFECLLRNVPEPNVQPRAAALGDRNEMVDLKLDECESDNCGAYYVEGAGTIPMVRLDDADIPRVDLLCLDVEGYEVEALRGARQLLKAWRPVVMLESKQLPHMTRWRVRADEAPALLRSMGWRLAASVHRDLVFVHEEKL